MNTINHCGPISILVMGSGNLRVSLNNLALKSYTCNPITMDASGDFKVTLGNFANQKMQLIIETSAIDEYFRISSIIPYIKPVASGYPL